MKIDLKDTSSILKRAFEKAKHTGFDISLYDVEIIASVDINFLTWYTYCRGIILSHSFAIAFFGEEDVLRIGLNKEQYIATWIEDHRKTYTLDEKKNIASQDWEYFKRQGNVKPVWMFHLQEMVISDNPILYLEAYL